MISSKKIIRIAKTWHNIFAMGRKRVSSLRTSEELNADGCKTSSVADKRHFVVYSIDQKRFVIPLTCLSSNIFRELFKLSKEEFGVSSDGPITLPCDAAFIEYAVSLIQRGHVAKDLEKALLYSITTSRCSILSSFHQRHTSRQLLVCGY